MYGIYFLSCCESIFFFFRIILDLICMQLNLMYRVFKFQKHTQLLVISVIRSNLTCTKDAVQFINVVNQLDILYLKNNAFRASCMLNLSAHSCRVCTLPLHRFYKKNYFSYTENIFLVKGTIRGLDTDF